MSDDNGFAMAKLRDYERMPSNFRELVDRIWVRPGAVPQCREELDCWEAEWRVNGSSVVVNLGFEADVDGLLVSVFAVAGGMKLVFHYEFEDLESVTDDAVQKARGELDLLAPMVQDKSIQRHWDVEFERHESALDAGSHASLMDGAL